MVGEPPRVDQDRRHAFDIRRAVERRFGSNPNSEGEGEHTANVADRYAQAVLDGDKDQIALLRGVITDLCGPQRQGLDIEAKVYSVVNIVGLDDEADEPEPDPLDRVIG